MHSETFIISEVKVVSLNNAYEFGRGRVFLRKEAKEYKTEIKRQIKAQLFDKKREFIKNIKPDDHLFVELIYSLLHEELYTLANKIRRRDLDNMHKLTIDGIFDAFNSVNPKMDDSQIMRKNAEKTTNKTSNQIIIKIGVENHG